MSVQVQQGKRGLTDPEMVKEILEAIPDQPLDTQRKMNYFVKPRGRRLTEYEVLTCYAQPTPDWIPGGWTGAIGLKNSTAAVRPGVTRLPNCIPPTGTNTAIPLNVGTHRT